MSPVVEAYKDHTGTWHYGFDAMIARILDMEWELQQEYYKEYKPWLLDKENEDDCNADEYSINC